LLLINMLQRWQDYQDLQVLLEIIIIINMKKNQPATCRVKTSVKVSVKWITDKSPVQETVIKYGKWRRRCLLDGGM
jgi:hypothetical protein